MIIPQRHLEKKWTYINLYALLLGFIIGHCIILLNTLFTAEPIRLHRSIIVLVFSVIISLSIANTLNLLGRYLLHRFVNSKMPLIVFYTASILGMLIGTELSFLVLALTMDVHFPLRAQFNLLGLNLLIAIIVSTTIFLYEWQKSRYQLSSLKQELEYIKVNRLKKQAELKAIHEKINPHFLYNSLNAIAGLIPEDGAKAEAMTLKLAKLYRYSISHVHENFSKISEELKVIKDYLEIEQVRFGDRFKFEMVCDPALYDITIPRFLLQPLLENAVKHGLSVTKGNAYVKLKITAHKDQVFIAVYDNGRSFPKEINMGYGFRSMYDKLKLLYGDQYQIRLINSPFKHISIKLPVLAMADIQ